MIDEINATREEHIMTDRGPISSCTGTRSASSTSASFGSDAQSFGDALKAALLQDPT